ncbi:hypothetical protein CNMCM5793_004174 [Aspergillus hiratsukae]|uniref:Uncharacterized protein n=1 Tax=Aspergillus hiratsukae TaxID=1194566 RepID=A0A8H6ULD0_9EURO|nr:hypothetical protein CNMCM5793_004174 [Aspergillus hiratsukae]KAF7159133.1 hypothetical protein CNMCM6106_006218 [Aspergillus hiratsukae]
MARHIQRPNQPVLFRASYADKENASVTATFHSALSVQRNRRNAIIQRVGKGYINQLEQRLADTELALYEALATLRTISGSSLVRASWKADISPKRKAARMQEWTQFPLREPSDLERWLEAKKHQFMIMEDIRDAQRTRPLGEIESADSTMQRRNARHSNMSGMLIGTESPDGSQSDRQTTAWSMQTNPQMSIYHATSPSTSGRGAWGETSRHGLSEQIQASPGEVVISGEEVQMGKAGQLSKKDPAIYF